MPRKVDAAAATRYWQAGMANAAQKISDGIDRVTESPGQKAAAKRDKYLAGVNASVDTWARNTAAVDVGTWKAAAKAGVSRVAEGAQNKGQKYGNKISAVFSHMDSVLSQVDSMPDNTLEQRIAKSAAFQRGMSQFRG